jgi:uncharacterized protein YndB with AHSA1/START domain
MLEFENTIRIDRRIEEVFAFLSDFENIPKWNYYVLEVRQLSESPRGIGTTYHQVRKTDEQDFRIIEFEPSHTVAVKTLPQSSPSLEMRFTLYEEGDTTRVRDEWKLDTGRLALLERLTGGRESREAQGTPRRGASGTSRRQTSYCIARFSPTQSLHGRLSRRLHGTVEESKVYLPHCLLELEF